MRKRLANVEQRLSFQQLDKAAFNKGGKHPDQLTCIVWRQLDQLPQLGVAIDTGEHSHLGVIVKAAKQFPLTKRGSSIYRTIVKKNGTRMVRGHRSDERAPRCRHQIVM